MSKSFFLQVFDMLIKKNLRSSLLFARTSFTVTIRRLIYSFATQKEPAHA